MPACSECGRGLVRTHRTPFQKPFYSEVFRCPKCGNRLRRLHPWIGVRMLFVASRYTRCIQCGTLDVCRIPKRDRVESLSTNLLSRLQHLTGAPLNKCWACRLQYYDWRPPRPTAHTTPAADYQS